MNVLDQTWAERGACNPANRRPEWPTLDFFPEPRRGVHQTIPLEIAYACAGCPVRLECQEHAIAYEPAGIWAGLTEQDRRVIREERGLSRRYPHVDVIQELRRISAEEQRARRREYFAELRADPEYRAAENAKRVARSAAKQQSIKESA